MHGRPATQRLSGITSSSGHLCMAPAGSEACSHHYQAADLGRMGRRQAQHLRKAPRGIHNPAKLDATPEKPRVFGANHTQPPGSRCGHGKPKAPRAHLAWALQNRSSPAAQGKPHLVPFRTGRPIMRVEGERRRFPGHSRPSRCGKSAPGKRRSRAQNARQHGVGKHNRVVTGAASLFHTGACTARRRGPTSI